MFGKIAPAASRHKFAVLLIVALVATGSYYGYKNLKNGAAETKYVLAAVEKGTIITSVSGSGQVSASNQVDVKVKVSGAAVFVGVKNGQEIKSGALLAQLDARDAQKSVRDAEVSLESAKLALLKLEQPADELSILQSENALVSAKQSKEKARDDIKKAYDDALTDISNAFIDFPTVMTGANDLLHKFTYSQSQENASYYTNLVQSYDSAVFAYKDSAITTYGTARTAYDKNFIDYKNTSRYAETAAIEELLAETYDTAKSIAEAIKNSDNFLSFVKDKLVAYNNSLPSQLATHKSSLATYTDTVNSHLLALLNGKNTIKNTKDAIESAERTIVEKTESLAKLKTGADPLDIQSQKLSIKQRENALLDAKEKFADYFIRAPFDGVVAESDIKKDDSILSGAIIATIVTKEHLAEIPLNEVDVAKIKVGQKATLSFDAIEGLSIAGQVVEIATIGTVMQGVVNYTVKIGLDTQDERVKPGMSASASIITNVKQDVLMVPSSAVKSQGARQYVEALDQVAAPGAQPREAAVEVGLSNDTMIEIISGLKEGDQVITQTINSAAGAAQNSTQPRQNTNFRIPGLPGGGGMSH